jgi:proline racemase
MFNTVETHSGEPMRVITGGVPHIPGDTVYEQMKWLEKNDDQIRKLMLREPRGYPPVCSLALQRFLGQSLCCQACSPPQNRSAVVG